MFTDNVMVLTGKKLSFGSSWETDFHVPNRFIFHQNAPKGSKFGEPERK